MDRLRAALGDVSGLANVAAKLTHSKPLEGVDEKVGSGTDGLVYSNTNCTLSVPQSGAGGTLSLAGHKGISSLPSLIVAASETGTNDTVSAPGIGSSLTERRANQIADFLNEAVAMIRDGMKGMLTSSLENGTKEEATLLRNKIENNNKSIREIHERHSEIMLEREQLLVKVAETESQLIKQVAEHSEVLNELERTELELKVSNDALKQLMHENTVVRVEVDKFRNVSQLIQEDLKASREKETAVNRDNLELKLKLNERDIEILDLKAKLQQLSEKVGFLETGQKLEERKVAESGTEPYVVGLVKTTEILDKVAQLKDKVAHGDFSSHLRTTETTIRELVSEHERCKDTMFLLRRHMLPLDTNGLLNGDTGDI